MFNIFIVEDESIIAKDIEGTLTSIGYSVCGIANTANEAIKKLENLKPHLILIDIMLKKSTGGLDVAEKIQKEFNIPIIFITSHKDTDIINKANKFLPHGYIFKPFQPQDIQITVDLALKRHYFYEKGKNNQNLLNKMLNETDRAIITTDAKSKITFLNKNAEELFNISSNRVLNKEISNIIKIVSKNNKKLNLHKDLLYSDVPYYIPNNLDMVLNISIEKIESDEAGFLYIFRDVTNNSVAKKLLETIITNTSASVGEKFFRLLVKSLAELLNVKFAFICDYHDDKKDVARIISAYENNSFSSFKKYHMKNTPSEKVKHGNLVFYEDDIQKKFPKDNLLKKHNLKSYFAVPIFSSERKVIGHMGVMNDKPMKENKIYEQILRFMSERATAELERKVILDEISKNEKKYKILVKKYASLLDSLPQAILETNSLGMITFANKFAMDIYELKPEELDLGLNALDFIDNKNLDKIISNFRETVNGKNLGFIEYKSQKYNGKNFDSVIHLTKIKKENTKDIGVRFFIIDITNAKNIERNLKEAEERYNLTLKGTNEGFWDINIKTGEIYFSSVWKNMLGYKESEINNTLNEWFLRVHPEDLANLKEFMNNGINAIQENFECEYRIKNFENNYIWMLCKTSTIKDKANNVIKIGGTQINVHKHKEKEQLLEKLLKNNSHDLLTGLPNREYFVDKLEKSLAISKTNKNYLFSVMYIDIDRFKIINDSLGHSFGNILLVNFTRKIQNLLGTNDTLSRLGGDEFAILFDNLEDTNQTIKIAEMIQRELRKPFIINEKEVFSNVSIGIAYNFSGNESPDEVLRASDIAMSKAKSLGKARYQIFDSSMQKNTVETFELETDLRHAIERDELKLYYQPIINLKTGKITGFEALVRWFNKNKGLIPSDIFIPIAEETGYIIKIGKWVFKEACKQLKIWNETLFKENNITININISSRQFSHPRLVDHIYEIINGVGIEPNKIKIEITESSIMDNVEQSRKMLEKLQEIGLQIQIDDFGTGYSSLSYLHRFPVNNLKVDKSFVSKMSISDDNLEIVKTIIMLAKNLNLKTTAEGIETKEQLNKLRELNCEYGQGYYFSRPIPVEEVEIFINNNQIW
ncbi:MAG: EAL domain-containing protein [Candidatus Sericytochromatia bacterium]